MTEQLAANEVETAPLVDEPIEENANSEVEATETLEAIAEGEGDSFIPEDKISDGVQKRINKLTWEKHEAERKAAAKIKELEDKIAANVATVTEDVAPTLKQFDYDDEKYQAAMIDYRVEQRLKTLNPVRNEPAQPTVDPVAESFLAKRRKYAEENTEYTQLSTDPSMANAITPNTGMYNYIVTADNGPKLHHHLLNNTDELIRIQALPDWQQGAELAKIESKLNQVKATQRSKAPAPVKPVSSGKTATTSSSASPFPTNW